MQEPRPRALVNSPTLIRLLSRAANLDPPAPPALTDRLTDWIDWSRGVALYTALDAAPGPAAGPCFDQSVDDECAHTRARLEGRIAELQAWMPAPADVSAIRRRHVELQRDIQVVTGRLRGRLRDLLAVAGMGRLAEVDAVMERVLSPRESTLLGNVPDLLQDHFESIRGAADAADLPAHTPPAALEAFRRDMQAVLHAELDVRFHPIEGLLAALRNSRQES